MVYPTRFYYVAQTNVLPYTSIAQGRIISSFFQFASLSPTGKAIIIVLFIITTVLNQGYIAYNYCVIHLLVGSVHSSEGARAAATIELEHNLRLPSRSHASSSSTTRMFAAISIESSSVMPAVARLLITSLASNNNTAIQQQSSSSVAHFEAVSKESAALRLEELRTGRRQPRPGVDERYIAAARMGHAGIWTGELADTHGAVFDAYALPEDITTRSKLVCTLMHPSFVRVIVDYTTFLALSVFSVPCACNDTSFVCKELQVLVLIALIALRLTSLIMMKSMHICTWWSYQLECAISVSWALVITALWMWDATKIEEFTLISAFFQNLLLLASILQMARLVYMNAMAKYEVAMALRARKSSIRETATSVALAALRWRRNVSASNSRRERDGVQEDEMEDGGPAATEIEMSSSLSSPLLRSTAEVAAAADDDTSRDRDGSLMMSVMAMMDDSSNADMGEQSSEVENPLRQMSNSAASSSSSTITSAEDAASVNDLGDLEKTLHILSRDGEGGELAEEIARKGMQSARDIVQRLGKRGKFFTEEEARKVQEATSDEAAAQAILDAAEAMFARRRKANAIASDQKAGLAMHMVIKAASAFSEKLKQARELLRPTGLKLWEEERSRAETTTREEDDDANNVTEEVSSSAREDEGGEDTSRESSVSVAMRENADGGDSAPAALGNAACTTERVVANPVYRSDAAQAGDDASSSSL